MSKNSYSREKKQREKDRVTQIYVWTPKKSIVDE